MKKLKVSLVLASILMLPVAQAMAEEDEFAGAGKKETAAVAPSGPVTTVDAATAATIKGKISFKGTAPQPKQIKMDADPNCVGMHSAPVMDKSVLIGGDGAFENVFVYISKGLEGKNFPVPAEAVVFDQKGCEYSPRIFGVRAGQPVEIINSDPTLHNVHAMPTASSPFNVGMPIQGMKIKKTFDKPEQMVSIKCDVHPWMNAYVGVMEHPFFATTGKDGSFELKNVPPGTYEIVAWQEKAGKQTQSVTVGAKETKEVDFTFERPAKPQE